MNLCVYLIACMALLVPAAFSQNPIAADALIQVKYIGNLASGDSVVNITNTGAGSNSNLCANVYVFAPDEQLISCCTCVVTPNGLVSLSARLDLASNPLTPAVPGSIVVKLLGSTGTCNASSPGPRSAGLAAWGSTVHIPPFAPSRTVTETAFTPSTIGAADFIKLTTYCGFIQSNGSGYGICSSCRTGALGASKK